MIATSRALGLVGLALLAVHSPSVAADLPLCRLSTSDIDGYSGQVEVRGTGDSQKLGGYLTFRIPDGELKLDRMEFAPAVPVKLGMLVDFAIPASDSGRALEALSSGGVTDLRLFVGKLVGTLDQYNKGADILTTYKLDIYVRGIIDAPNTYVPVPQTRFDKGSYFSFGGGDIGVARRLAASLLAADDAKSSRYVSIGVSGDWARLEWAGQVKGYRAAATRLVGGANALKERAAKGQCKPV